MNDVRLFGQRWGPKTTSLCYVCHKGKRRFVDVIINEHTEACVCTTCVRKALRKADR